MISARCGSTALVAARPPTLEPTDDKTIHLEHFLSPTEFDLTLLAGRSLYLAPAHPAAMKPFVVIRQALLRADKWALGRTVFWREQGNSLHIELLPAAPESRPRKEANAGCSYIVPDFLVEMTSGQKRLVEVKPSDRLAKPLAQRKLSVARQYAATEGWAFHVVTEKELQPGPLLSNVQLVGRYRQASTDPALLLTVQGLVAERGVPLADLCRQADQSDSTRARMHIFHLLAVGDLSFDPRQESLSDQTLIYPGGVITWDPFDSVWAPNGCSTGGPGVWSASSLPTASSPKTPSSS